MEDRVRVTVSMRSEDLEVFKDMARVSGVSLSRCIGDWCGDTHDGAVFVVQKMVELKTAPGRLMAEVHAHGLGVYCQPEDRLRPAAGMGLEAIRAAAQPAPERLTPRPVIRGESPPQRKRGAGHG